MANSGDDAAASARQEDQQLTEIAQIVPGHTAKALELLANRDVPPTLLAAFQEAANSASYVQKMEVLSEQLQDKNILQQKHDEEQKQRDDNNRWLESMSPEYQQAYSNLMVTIDHANTQYDQLRERLNQRGQAFDQDAEDIDDKALHLSDGSRAYVNGKGELVDKNGIPLNGAKKDEANTLAQLHAGPISTIASYQQNEAERASNAALSQRVDKEEQEANDFGEKVREHKVPDTKEVQQGDAEIQRRLEATQADYANSRNSAVQPVNSVSMADLSDLDGGDPSGPSATNHTSYAAKVDPDAGIKANGVTVTFNSATQSPPPTITAPVPSQRPITVAPVPG